MFYQESRDQGYSVFDILATMFTYVNIIRRSGRAERNPNFFIPVGFRKLKPVYKIDSK